jgi:hypothetical protein
LEEGVALEEDMDIGIDALGRFHEGIVLRVVVLRLSSSWKLIGRGNNVGRTALSVVSGKPFLLMYSNLVF